MPFLLSLLSLLVLNAAAEDDCSVLHTKVEREACIAFNEISVKMDSLGPKLAIARRVGMSAPQGVVFSGPATTWFQITGLADIRGADALVTFGRDGNPLWGTLDHFGGVQWGYQRPQGFPLAIPHSLIMKVIGSEKLFISLDWQEKNNRVTVGDASAQWGMRIMHGEIAMPADQPDALHYAALFANDGDPAVIGLVPGTAVSLSFLVFPGTVSVICATMDSAGGSKQTPYLQPVLVEERQCTVPAGSGTTIRAADCRQVQTYQVQTMEDMLAAEFIRNGLVVPKPTRADQKRMRRAYEAAAPKP